MSRKFRDPQESYEKEDLQAVAKICCVSWKTATNRATTAMTRAASADTSGILKAFLHAFEADEIDVAES